MPILFFSTFVFSVLLFVGAASLLFSLFWIGIAIFILVPFLVVTSSLALVTWAFGAAAFSASRSAFNAVQAMATDVERSFGDPHHGDASHRSRLAAPAPSSSSSSRASSSKVGTRDTKQGEGLASKATMPTHPEPGSDVDALEP